jgi:GT2 family glycosyltransferase
MSNPYALTPTQEKPMKITVMITTRNRRVDLNRTLERLGRMTPPPDEILLTADGCTDDTVRMVEADFPHCLLIINEKGQGSIPSRDDMVKRATGDIVMSLDDDSYPLEDDFFARLPNLFERHPEVAVMTFPELRDDGSFVPKNRTPETPGRYLSAYANNAAAMRREAFIACGGYVRFFVHAYEEPDYALQCYEHLSAVWFEPTLTIRHHFSSTNRNEQRTHHLNARNEFWSVLMRCPFPWLPLVAVYRVGRQLAHACSKGLDWIIKEPEWWIDALSGLSRCKQSRRPVPWHIYSGWMRLARRKIHTLAGLEEHFQTSFPKMNNDTPYVSNEIQGRDRPSS